MTETATLALLETRLDAGDEAGLIEGFAARFGEVDSFGDTIEAGAFAASLAEHRAAGTAPVMLWSHDPGEVIGRWDQISEEAGGLRVRGRLNLDVQRARETRSLIQSGAVTGLSIGFRTRKAAPGPEGTRKVLAIDLHEISIVALPAAQRARVDTIKSALPREERDIPMTDTQTTPPAAGDKAPDPVAALTDRIGKIEEILARNEIRSQRPGATVPPAATLETRAFDGFVRRGIERLTADETRSLNVSTDTAGGYLVPEDFQKEILKNLVQFSPVRQLARVTPTSGAEVILPKRTGTLTASWVAELADRTGTEPAYGQLKVPVYEMACHVDVSNQLLEDSAFDLASELSQDLAEEFGRAEGAAFISGDGTGKPSGLLDADIATINSGSASAITADSLIDLFHALPGFYAGNATWIMNRQTLGMVRKLKDGAGHYLLVDPMASAAPATLLGLPVVEAIDMPNVAAGSTPIALGDFKQGFRILDRVNLSILRDPYSVQAKGLVRFHARRRVGAGVVKAEAFRLLKIAA